MSDKLERFVRCDCYHHAMCVNVDKDDSQVYVSQWSYGRGNELDWREQLRYIWRIISKGKPYEDEIVLSFKEAHDLGKFLTEQCVEPKTKDPNNPDVLGTVDFIMADGRKGSYPIIGTK